MTSPAACLPPTGIRKTRKMRAQITKTQCMVRRSGRPDPQPNRKEPMSPPHIPKISAAAFQQPGGARAGGKEAQQRQGSPLPVANPEVQAVVVSRSLQLLETMASRVSETTGEPCEAQSSGASADSDPSYRVQLMSFIVGSLSRAAQSFRDTAVEIEEPEETEEGQEEQAPDGVEEVDVEAALPSVPDSEGAGGVEGEGVDASPRDDAPVGYGKSGHAVEEPAEGTVKRWA